MAKSACFSGHREANFDRDFCEAGGILRARLANAIKAAYDCGFRHFYSGMARGFDIIAAEAVLQEKNLRSPDISLICAIPFKGQEDAWNRGWRERHNEILRQADDKIVLKKNT